MEWNGNMSGAKCSQDISTTLKLNQMLQPNYFLILLQPYSQTTFFLDFSSFSFSIFFFIFLEELYSFFLFLIFFLSFFEQIKLKQLLQTFLLVQT